FVNESIEIARCSASAVRRSMPLIGISFVAPSKAGKPSQSQRPESRSQNQKLYRPAGQVFETHAVVIIHDRQAEPNCANSCCQSKHTEPEQAVANIYI